MASSLDFSGFDEGWSQTQVLTWLNEQINRIAEPSDMFKAGKLLYRDGLYMGAAKVLQSYCDSGSAESPGYHLLGYAYYMSGESPKSIPYLRKAVCQGFDADWQLLVEMVLSKDQEEASQSATQRGAADIIKPLGNTVVLGPLLAPLASPVSPRSVAGSPARSERSARVLSTPEGGPNTPSDAVAVNPDGFLTGYEKEGELSDDELGGLDEVVMQQKTATGTLSQMEQPEQSPAHSPTPTNAATPTPTNLVEQELAKVPPKPPARESLSHMKSRIEIDGVEPDKKR